MHDLSSAFILGYHGCDRSVAERVLRGEPFIQSSNAYDWLGSGIYFWESNPQRGLDFARELTARRRGRAKITHPAVVGAVIDLGVCLDLTTTAGVDRVRLAFSVLENIVSKAEPPRPLPENNKDGLRRNLDCAVVNTLHDILRQDGKPPFDTVKGIFVEGGAGYPGSGFQGKTHTQICVRNVRSIKGVFRVPMDHLS